MGLNGLAKCIYIYIHRYITIESCMICNHDYIYILKNIESYICIFAIIQIDYLLSQILFIYE